MTKYSDIKLIDELLCDLRIALGSVSMSELERHSSVTRQAFARLREAYERGQTVTLSFAKYFDNICQD